MYKLCEHSLIFHITYRWSTVQFFIALFYVSSISNFVMHEAFSWPWILHRMTIVIVKSSQRYNYINPNWNGRGFVLLVGIFDLICMLILFFVPCTISVTYTNAWKTSMEIQKKTREMNSIYISIYNAVGHYSD